jgi:hypothetical protein
MDKLLSKEHIFRKCFLSAPHIPLRDSAYEAMDIHAKQTAIAFYNWMEKENTIWRNEQGEPLTDDEIYSLFELKNNVKP